MRVISTVACGFKRDGSVLLRKGRNDLAEPLIATERAFVDAMVKAKIATIVSEQVPDAPVSETKIVAAAPAPPVSTTNTAPVAPKLRRRSVAR